jgi:3'-phosphoadenosine 5'-phosphosulfate sulfotransferase (PAPS reductase)/FAD synthetase
MTPDPFHIVGPAVVSFSGGRTSGYMLWRILQAHGGVLPPDMVVCFANTGREMPATLDFVHECAERWRVPIRWLEFTARRKDGWAETSWTEASRDGEPFAALIATQQMLPNPVMRSCTQEMKIRTIARFVVASYGWKRWLSVVGLRADEPGRVGRSLARNEAGKDRWRVVCPLATAGVTKDDVLAFWRDQDFDLGITSDFEGNCDGCFLKSRGAIAWMMQRHPERMRWWPEQEAVALGRGVSRSPAAALFRKDRPSYAAMMQSVLEGDVPRHNIFDDGTSCNEGCTD